MWSLLHSSGINNLVAVRTTLCVDLDYKLPTTLNMRTRNSLDMHVCFFTVQSIQVQDYKGKGENTNYHCVQVSID